MRERRKTRRTCVVRVWTRRRKWKRRRYEAIYVVVERQNQGAPDSTGPNVCGHPTVQLLLFCECFPPDFGSWLQSASQFIPNVLDGRDEVEVRPSSSTANWQNHLLMNHKWPCVYGGIVMLKQEREKQTQTQKHTSEHQAHVHILLAIYVS